MLPSDVLMATKCGMFVLMRRRRRHLLPQATLASGSCFKWASRTASLIWSHILSEREESWILEKRSPQKNWNSFCPTKLQKRASRGEDLLIIHSVSLSCCFFKQSAAQNRRKSASELNSAIQKVKVESQHIPLASGFRIKEKKTPLYQNRPLA